MSAYPAMLANKLSRLFETGGVDALCCHYTYPLPVQVEGTYHVFHGQQDLQTVFTSFCNTHKATGQTSPTARVAAIELPRSGRFRIWVDWVFPQETPQSTFALRMIYYCTLVGHRTAIDMIACNNHIARDHLDIALQKRSA
ncbi:MAG: hypothetical protein ACRCS3_15395 [Paracoccaceae bacterium]